MATKKAQPQRTKFPIADRIKPVSEKTSFLAALVYGRSGTGKTHFGSTFPKPILLLDIREEGTDTIAKVEGIDRLEVNTWADFEDAYWFIAEGEHKYKTILLDQISTLQDLAMEKIRKDENLQPTDMFHKRHWGQISGLMKTWLFSYRDLTKKDLHVCMIAHDRVSTNDDTAEDALEPNVGARVMPSLAAAINGAVDMIGNTYIRERFEGVGKEKVRFVDYMMRIGPHAYYSTKIRRPVDAGPPPEAIANPTFEKITLLTRGESLKRKLKKEK